jgi:hypothetical protein
MKKNAKILAANITTTGTPTASPIFAPAGRPLDVSDAAAALDVACALDPAVFVLSDELLVLGKSPSLYRIHIAPAGISLSLNVNVCVKPFFSPSPVYAIVVTTVETTVEVQ